MRIDKFLKVSRIIKRRTVANDACNAGRIMVNEKTVKPGYELKIGDIISVQFGEHSSKYKVKNLNLPIRKDDTEEMYEMLNE